MNAAENRARLALLRAAEGDVDEGVRFFYRTGGPSAGSTLPISPMDALFMDKRWTPNRGKPIDRSRPKVPLHRTRMIGHAKTHTTSRARTNRVGWAVEILG